MDEKSDGDVIMEMAIVTADTCCAFTVCWVSGYTFHLMYFMPQHCMFCLGCKGDAAL